jgi:BirA family biotin operon repressor/biotin-[acetyl-CoA-carboxylase] ligase
MAGTMTSRSIHWQVQHQESIDSTNRFAMERALELWKTGQGAEGVVITATRQSAGKGQHGRSFESPVGGLYLSAIIEELSACLRDKLALLAGVAACEAMRRFTSLRIGLRWPNDIMLADKKLGGILCESVVMGERWAGVIGIGLNINTDISQLPPELHAKATSLRAHDNTPREISSAQILLLDSLSRILETANAQGLAPILTRATQLDTLRGKQIELQNGEQRITGTAEGLGPNGELVLRTPQNGIVACAMGTLISVNGSPLR